MSRLIYVVFPNEKSRGRNASSPLALPVADEVFITAAEIVAHPRFQTIFPDHHRDSELVLFHTQTDQPYSPNDRIPYNSTVLVRRRPKSRYERIEKKLVRAGEEVQTAVMQARQSTEANDAASSTIVLDSWRNDLVPFIPGMPKTMLNELRPQDITETILDDIKQGKAAKHGITRLADGTLVRMKAQHMRIAPSATTVADQPIEPRLIYDTKTNVERRCPAQFDDSMYCSRCNQLMFGACMFVPSTSFASLDQELAAYASASDSILSLVQLSTRHCLDCFLYHVQSDEQLARSLALCKLRGWALVADSDRRWEVFKYLCRLDRIDDIPIIGPVCSPDNQLADVFYQ